MMIIRPVESKDLNHLVSLGNTAGVGLTTLPPDRNILKQKIIDSSNSFVKEINKPIDEYYLFVLENSETGQVIGTTAIASAVGANEAFYNYRIGTIVHACWELSVYNKINTLYLSNDYTGFSEICTLYLDPENRKGNNGKLLSKCRFFLWQNSTVVFPIK